MKFKVGDTAKCINTEGWADRKWYNGRPFKVEFEDMEHMNFSYPEDFIIVESAPKKISQYGIVKFLKGLPT